MPRPPKSIPRGAALLLLDGAHGCAILPAMRTLAWFGIASFALLAAASHAADPQDFYVRSAQDLVRLCSVTDQEEIREEAIHFCHGFAAGAWQYHLAQANGPDGRRLVCPPDSVTRDAAIAGFVEWSARHPERMGEPAVEALFRFLIEKWPCPAPAAAPPRTEGGSR